MPDTGGFGHDHHTPPMRWSDAFAALPLESAGPQAWERLRGRLPAPAAARARRRWPAWLAAAASLALAMAIIPLLMWPGTMDRHARSDGQPQTTIERPHDGASPDIAARPAQPADATPAAPAEPARTAPASGLRGSDGQAQQHAIATERPRRPAAARRGANANSTPSTHDLEPLYAESARLEDLLALARDDRVAGSTATALTDSLEAELAAIDAALIQHDLGAPRRVELWQRRVDALRQLAGIETTRRLLSARGETYDVALVGID